MDLTVIIPARNEEQRIRATLESYLTYFQHQFRFLVVVNGTKDGTLAVVQEYANRFLALSWIDIKEKIGKGGAVRAGFRHATTEWVAFIDADNATKPKDFETVLNACQGWDGAIASRGITGAVAKRTVLRRFIGWCFHLVTRWLIGLPFVDTQCGYKVFRRDRVVRILPHLRIRNMAFDVELLAFLLCDGARIREVPVVWEEIPGAPRAWERNIFATGLEMFRTLIELRRRLHASSSHP